MENESSIFEQAVAEVVTQNSKELHIPEVAYTKIVAATFEKRGETIQELKDAIEQTDYDKCHDLAHAIKGIFNNLRLTHIAQYAETIDDIAQASGSQSEMQALIIDLQEQFEKTKEYFSQL